MKTSTHPRRLILGVVVSACLICVPSTGQVINTVAGGGQNDGRAAMETELAAPLSSVVDAGGNLYIAETLQDRIRRVDRITGAMTTVAGTGRRGFSGDGGPAVTALLAEPRSIAIDRNGNLFIADTANNRVRRVDAITQVITTVAGNGTWTVGGDGRPATSVGLHEPVSIALDPAGNLYIGDRRHHQIRRVDRATNIITTVAGTGSPTFSGDGGPATAAALRYPAGIAFDGSGAIYIADASNQRIRRVDGATGVITTFAGNGTSAFSGDGGPATAAAFSYPSSVAIDAGGDLYVGDDENARIRRIDATSHFVSTIAGTGSWGYSGDGGPATAAAFHFVASISLDPAGNLLVADAGNGRIRRIDQTSKIISTIAGSNGDGAPAVAAILYDPRGVVTDASGNLFIADTFHHRVRKVDATFRNITTVAGSGQGGYSGDGGPATSARLYSPAGLAIDRLGNLFIAELDNFRIRKVDAATGTIATIAGGGDSSPGDNGPGTEAMIGQPYGVAVDHDGNVYIAATESQEIRVVNAATGIITRFAGGGSGGDGVAATDSKLSYPEAVAIDPDGNVYIADSGAGRIRKVDSSSRIITTIAGGGSSGELGDGGPATNARLRHPSGLAIDVSGNLYIADDGDHRIRRVDAATGIIATVAGDGIEGWSGDGGPAATAQLAYPHAIAIDSAGTLYVADTRNNRVRVVGAAFTTPRRRAVRR